MTRVLVKYQLQEPLGDRELARLSDLRGVYGIMGFQVSEGEKGLAVEYDATRLTPLQVTAILHQNGIAAVEQ